MNEMRRLGAGTQPTTGRTRRTARAEHQRRLAERVAQVPTRRADAPDQSLPTPAAGEKRNGTENGAANGSRGPDATPAQPPAEPAAPQPAVAAAETETLPEERRKGRLLDRITGLGKT
jgi:hypothetical protein